MKCTQTTTCQKPWCAEEPRHSTSEAASPDGPAGRVGPPLVSGNVTAKQFPTLTTTFPLCSCVSGWMGKLRLSCDLPEHQLHATGVCRRAGPRFEARAVGQARLHHVLQRDFMQIRSLISSLNSAIARQCVWCGMAWREGQSTRPGSRGYHCSSAWTLRSIFKGAQGKT
ncbi:receptor activity-modifying protein 3 isoform X2 [Phocoena sinus]|uniref:receptor activity-modifying protein 3 isoform X2 n=1 Tax=Phocoena sinus TaxID=42100 RepID=UPI0013C46DB8|nr:receptor activity-modifying protein 3 isoform X2 [Phocoena sinus]